MGELHTWLEEWLSEAWEKPYLVIEKVQPTAGSSYELAEPWRASKYESADANEVAGVMALDLVVRDSPTALAHKLAVVLKARHLAGMGRTLLPGLFRQAGIQLPRAPEDYPALAEFLTCADREIAIYRLQTGHEAFRRFLPARRAERVRVEEDSYLLLIERVDDAELMDSADDISRWTSSHVGALVDAMAALHAVWLGRTDELKASPWPSHAFDAASVIDSRDLWVGMLKGARRIAPELMDQDLFSRCIRLVESVDDWYPIHDQLPRTLVHDDFNPRNACFRSDSTPLVYDWELALIDVPQRDLAEMLTFCLHPDADEAMVRILVERHRRRLSELASIDLDADQWWEGLRVELRFEAINRLALQLVFRSAHRLGYVPRMTASVRNLLHLYG